jgi:hypothetical protein
MKRLTQIVLVGVLLLAMMSMATAQRAPEPVVRTGNFFEVGNDVFMHIIATIDARYVTVENRDFEHHVRDRVNSRFPNDSAAQLTDADASWFLNRIGVEARYQKNLEFYLLFEHRQFVDGNLIDDRSNSTNPGGTDVFGRAAATENPGFRTERYWIRYKFPGTPLKLHVGADLWNVDQAGLVGDDDPRFALFGEFGDIDVMAAAVIQYESQRLGLTNDNDLIYYTFSAGYNLKPHRFQVDAVYMRDRFAGADLSFPRTQGGGIGFRGQRTDNVLIMASASGRLGPLRALVQGNVNLGRTKGGTAGLPGFPAGVASERAYDIFSGAAVAYAEADLGIARPFVAFVWGSGDGDPTDRKLRGFSPASWQDVTQITGVSWFEHLDTSTNFAGRDYACPARSQGVRTAPTAATGPRAIGTQVLGGGGGFECSHTVTNAFNQRLGFTSHLGITTPYSNPGTLVIAPGVKVYPLKGYEIIGWYVYRGMVKTSLLEAAFVRGIDPGFTGRIRKSQIHELGGQVMWTLNPYFDIRLAGQVAFLGEGFKDLARLADCDQQAPGFQACAGKDVALKAEARFRARF